MIAQQGLEKWHEVMGRMTSELLDEILAEDCVFHSPVVHTPQKGRDLTKLYLMAAFNVLPGQKSSSAGAANTESSKFRYVREVVGEKDAVLEFMTEVEGITINGVDMITWNDEGKIIDFKVMVRPLKAIQKLHAQMAAMLASMKPDGA